MRKLIVGSMLFISGMIGVASVIITCGLVIAGKLTIHLSVPLAAFFAMMILGIVFVFKGIRSELDNSGVK